MVKKYKKLTSNPLGLGRGLVITNVEYPDGIFTDKDFHDVNKQKLKAAIRTGLAVEVSKTDDAKQKSDTLDDEVETLTERLERVTTERDEAIAELAELKGGEDDAWITMSEESLAEEYTVSELRKIIRDEFPEYKLGRGLKEAELAALIVKLIAAADAELKDPEI